MSYYEEKCECFNVKIDGAIVNCNNGMQKTTSFSVTEVERVTGVTCTQDMSIGLEVELPVILEIDNKGSVNMSHNPTGWKVEVYENQNALVERIIGELNYSWNLAFGRRMLVVQTFKSIMKYIAVGIITKNEY